MYSPCARSRCQRNGKSCDQAELNVLLWKHPNKKKDMVHQYLAGNLQAFQPLKLCSRCKLYSKKTCSKKKDLKYTKFL